MKKLLFILFATLGAFGLRAGNTVAEADSAYMNDDFTTAAALYEQAIQELGPSAERYYNAGNAYYRDDQLGMAIVNYERALRLDPGNKDIIDNLEFVNSKTTDRIDAPESVLGSATDTLAKSVHSNVWAWVALTLFILALAGVGCYFFASGVKLRKIGFFGAGIMLILCVGANILAYRGARTATATNQAVVVTPSVMLSTTPRAPKDRSEEAMQLHEGTKVQIVDSLASGADKWYDVKIDDNHRAWIPGNAIVII